MTLCKFYENHNWNLVHLRFFFLLSAVGGRVSDSLSENAHADTTEVLLSHPSPHTLEIIITVDVCVNFLPSGHNFMVTLSSAFLTSALNSMALKTSIPRCSTPGYFACPYSHAWPFTSTVGKRGTLLKLPT